MAQWRCHERKRFVESLQVSVSEESVVLHEPYICTLKSPELASGFLQDVTVRGHALAARQDFGRLVSVSAATVIINHQSSRQGRRGGFILVQRSSSLLLGRHAGTRFVALGLVQSLHGLQRKPSSI